MTVLYIHRTTEYGSDIQEIPHDVVFNILNGMELRDDRCPERKTS